MRNRPATRPPWSSGFGSPSRDTSEVEVAVHRTDLEVGHLARGDGRQRAAQREVAHRHAGAWTRGARGGRGQRRLGDVAGPVADGHGERVVPLGRGLGALLARAHPAVPDGRPVGLAAEAPHDVRLAVVGTEHPDHGRPVLGAAIAQRDARRVARKVGRDHGRLGGRQRGLRRHGVHADLLDRVDHPALVAADHAHPVGPVRDHGAVVAAAVPRPAVLRVAGEPAVARRAAAPRCPRSRRP